MYSCKLGYKLADEWNELSPEFTFLSLTQLFDQGNCSEQELIGKWHAFTLSIEEERLIRYFTAGTFITSNILEETTF